MKTIQILPSLEVGGVERGVIDLARAVKARGDEMVVISSGGALVAQLHKMGVAHYALPVHKKSLGSLALVGRIAEIIQRERADVVHARSRVPAWLALMACWKTQVPLVTTCHGYYSNHFLSRVMGWGKRVIVISRAVGRHMIDDFGVSPERIRLIHRGIDLTQFQYKPGKYGEPKKTLRIVNVGRLSPIKGQNEFLKAVHLLRRDLPHVEAWIVGSEGKGKQRYTEKLQKTIQHLGLSSCVKMLGTRQDIPELLAQADLLVLSTLIPEAFGRVIVEAGAVGTAVVATRVGGILDVIDHGENGLLVQPGDVPGLSAAMLDLLKDREKSRVFGERLRAKTEAFFTLDQMADKTLSVYHEVKKEKKILVIKLGAMGDLILAVPSLRMLRERYPEARLSLLVDKKIASVASACPYLDEVIPVDRARLSHLPFLLKLAKKFRRDGYDISVDFQNSKWTHLFAFLAGIPQRYGFRRGKMGFLLNRAERYAQVPEPPVQNQYRILKRLGVQKFSDKLELWSDPRSQKNIEERLAAAGAKKRVGFVMGSSPKWPTKRWPAASFRALADKLRDELDCQIFLIGASSEAAEAEKFAAEAGEGVFNWAGKTSPRELVAAVKAMDAVVTGDTAPLHIAAAVNTPVVAFFGPTDSRRHMPPAEQATVLSRRLPCQPCYKGKCRNPETLACLARISAQEVFEAVRHHLEKVPSLSA